MARVVGGIIATVLIGLGLLFLVAAASQNTGPRILIGLIAIGMGAGVVWLLALKRPEVVKKIELTQKIDLSGDIKVNELKCRNCGATLDQESVKVVEGATFVKCKYCKNEYQITEQPKW